MSSRHVTPILGFALAVTACALLLPRQAMAQSDTELRAGYCAAFLGEHLKQSRLERERDQRALARLWLYVMSRMEGIEPSQLSLVLNLGAHDGARLLPGTRACAQACGYQGSGSSSKARNCMDACFKSEGLEETLAKYEKCVDPTWLPF